MVASVLKLRFPNYIPILLLLLGSEVLTSLVFWSGTPEDAAPDWHFSFWYLEGRRLGYWMLCFSGSALVWLVVQLCLKKINKDTGSGGGQEFPLGVVLLPVAVMLAVGAEVATSVWYQRRLPFVLSFAMTASYLPKYVWGHLTRWAGITSG